MTDIGLCKGLVKDYNKGPYYDIRRKEKVAKYTPFGGWVFLYCCARYRLDFLQYQHDFCALFHSKRTFTDGEERGQNPLVWRGAYRGWESYGPTVYMLKQALAIYPGILNSDGYIE